MNKSLFCIGALLVLLFTNPSGARAASNSSGKEFYLAFQRNTTGTFNNLSLFITGQQNTQGVVKIPGLNFSKTFTVQADHVTTVALPIQAQWLTDNGISQLGVSITAQDDITVYGLNQQYSTTDAFLALPVDILGLEYMAMSYPATYGIYPSQVAVVGAYDNTQVTIVPSAAAIGRPAGVPFTVTLNRSDTYHLAGNGTADLTGSIITATAPVAVMSGVSCANVPIGYWWCDHLVEMMPPAATWGKSFLTVPLATRLKGDVFRILAAQDNTTVYINGTLTATLGRGKFVEKILTARSRIEASAPVLVAQYSVGQQFDNVVSDPFMMLIPPTEQFLTHYTFSTPATGFTKNFVNIVAPSTAFSALVLDGAPVDAALFSPIGTSGFSGAQVPISLGSHTIAGSVGFGIYVYGFSDYESYGYPGGMAFQFINPLGDAYPPNVGLKQIGDTIQGLATDSEDANANGILDAGEDLNGNGVIDRRSEDVNGNGVLDPGEDTNGNGYLDKDTGIFKVELDPGSTNLQLTVTPFIPGALAVNFSITLIDPNFIGTGILRVSDGAGNAGQSPIVLSKVALLKDIRVINTVSTLGNEIDPASFTIQPYSMTTTGDQAVIEWRYDYFPVNLGETLGFDVIMKNPVAGEQRLVSQKIELLYNDVNGNPVRTELGPQFVSVLSSAFDSALSTDKPEYQANENAVIIGTVKNLSEYARTVDAKVVVEDSQGVLLQEVATIPGLNFAAGETKTLGALLFNIGSSFAGNYRAHVMISENQKQIGEAAAQFKILPAMSLSSKVTVDKLSYNPNENALITSTITSQSPNYIFENLTAKISIQNPVDNSQLYTETKAITTLMSGATFAFKSYWNTGALAPGTYPVTIEVKDGSGSLLASGTAAVTIASVTNAKALLKGTVAVDKQSVLSGESISVSYSVTNVGNIDLSSVNLSVLTVHVVNQTVYDTISAQTPLPMGGSYPGLGVIDTTTYSAKDYLVILRAKIGDTEETLAGTYFRVEGAPSAPSLSLPGNGSDVETVTPVLIVNNASDPNDDKLTYEFEVYSDSGLTNQVTGTSGQGTVWTVPVSLTENATYYWRSRAYDGKHYGSWMTTASFRVNVANDAPTAPGISSPGDGSSVDTLTPALVITNAFDPDSASLTYNFDVALDPDFIQIVATITGVTSGQGTTSWQVPATLTENTYYYWRAQADDWLSTGPWMATAKFFVNTANDAPTAPVITLPANNSEISTTSADIVLINSTDPDSTVLTYYFELDTVMTFDSSGVIRSGSVPEGQGTTTWPVTGLKDNTQYYVRAKASDGQAESPSWSGVNSFFVNTVNDVPTVPVLANPSNGAGVNLFMPTLSMHNSTDPDKDVLTYEFEVYADSGLTQLVASHSGVPSGINPDATTSWQVPVNLTENQTYYWRARAFDGEAYSDWTTPTSFMVNTANDAPGAPKLHAPSEGSSLATLTPALSVTNAVDPDSDDLTYDFEVYAGDVLFQSITGVPEDSSGVTSAALSTALSDNTTYRWRARAYDGDRYGVWMAMATFSIHIPVTTINATVDFDPDTLNKKSNGTWVVVYIELPAGYNVNDIDISSIRLEGTIPAEPRPYAMGDHDKDGIPDLMVKFKRSDAINLLPNGDKVTVRVTGTVGTTTFEGVDTIRVIP